MSHTVLEKVELGLVFILFFCSERNQFSSSPTVWLMFFFPCALYSRGQFIHKASLYLSDSLWETAFDSGENQPTIAVCVTKAESQISIELTQSLGIYNIMKTTLNRQ